jgi:hypothetical protein
MQNMSTESPRQNSVRALFEDGMSSFLLSCDATFAELAEQLSRLADRHQGRPIAFDVKLGVPSH